MAKHIWKVGLPHVAEAILATEKVLEALELATEQQLRAEKAEKKLLEQQLDVAEQLQLPLPTLFPKVRALLVAVRLAFDEDATQVYEFGKFGDYHEYVFATQPKKDLHIHGGRWPIEVLPDGTWGKVKVPKVPKIPKVKQVKEVFAPKPKKVAADTAPPGQLQAPWFCWRLLQVVSPEWCNDPNP